MFGQTKLASIVHLATPNVPVTGALRKDFFEHLRHLKLLGHVGILALPLAQRFNNWIYWKNPTRYFYNRAAHPLLWHVAYALSKLAGRPIKLHMIQTRLDSFLYAFCVNRVCSEYASQLLGSNPSVVPAVDE